MTTTLTAPRPAAKPAAYPEPYHYRGTFDPHVAGTIVYAYVKFAEDYRGKYRPVVIVSVGRNCYYARPIYSNPSRYSGAWQATPVTLKGTDLNRAGYLAPGIVRVETTLKDSKGRLNLSDWGFLRSGNGNWGYDS